MKPPYACSRLTDIGEQKRTVSFKGDAIGPGRGLVGGRVRYEKRLGSIGAYARHPAPPIRREDGAVGRAEHAFRPVQTCADERQVVGVDRRWTDSSRIMSCRIAAAV